MNISVSIGDEDIATLDAYAQAHRLPSRSATIRQAIRLLRTSDLVLDYSAAFEEWSEAEAGLWDTAVGDGLDID